MTSHQQLSVTFSMAHKADILCSKKSQVRKAHERRAPQNEECPGLCSYWNQPNLHFVPQLSSNLVYWLPIEHTHHAGTAYVSSRSGISTADLFGPAGFKLPTEALTYAPIFLSLTWSVHWRQSAVAFSVVLAVFRGFAGLWNHRTFIPHSHPWWPSGKWNNRQCKISRLF